MQDAKQDTPSPNGVGKLRTFAREHPALTTLGLGGLGLLAGAELAGGILLGAGITALLRRDPHGHEMREKSRAMIDKMPHAMRDRARAVVDAVRGKQEAAKSSTEPVDAPFV